MDSCVISNVKDTFSVMETADINEITISDTEEYKVTEELDSFLVTEVKC